MNNTNQLSWSEDLPPNKIFRSNTSNISRLGNRVSINKGSVLAKDPTHLRDSWNINKTSGLKYLDIHLDDFYSFIGRTRRSKKISEALDCVLANLSNCVASNSQLIYSRDTGHGNAYIKVADYLEHMGLAINVIGKNNQWQENSSFLIPTKKFILEMKRADIRVSLKNGVDALEVRSTKDSKGKSKSLSLAKIKRGKATLYKSAVQSTAVYNKLWLDHEVTLDGLHIVPFSKRIFNNGGLNFGGRFYQGGHLELAKHERNRLLIDGEKTIEPDFKSFHPTIMYAMVGIQLNPDYDPYVIEDYDRDVVKLVCLSFINGKEQGFIRNVTKSGNPKNKAIMESYYQRRNTFEQRVKMGLPCKQPKKPKLSRGFIKGMPDHIKGKDLYLALLSAHKPIAALINTPHIGLMLQNIDSNIMAKVLNILCEQNIPALPVHDSVRVKVSDLDRAMSAMQCAYFESMSMNCVVDYDGKYDQNIKGGARQHSPYVPRDTALNGL